MLEGSGNIQNISLSTEVCPEAILKGLGFKEVISTQAI